MAVIPLRTFEGVTPTKFDLSRDQAWMEFAKLLVVSGGSTIPENHAVESFQPPEGSFIEFNTSTMTVDLVVYNGDIGWRHLPLGRVFSEHHHPEYISLILLQHIYAANVVLRGW